MARILLETLQDFRGGLNLRTDTFLLQNNESPDMLNVDVDPRGGFGQRKGVLRFGGSIPGTRTVESLWEYSTTLGTQQMMCSTNDNVLFSVGGDWTYAFNRDGLCRAVTFKDRCYVQNGTDTAVRWDGTTGVGLNQNWNNDIEAPTPAGAIGNMPQANLITAMHGMVFVADVTESGVRYPNRIRHSHPNFAEDWRYEDFIDIDTGVGGDTITAIMPFGDRLLIFKNNAVYALYGYSPETFQVIEVDLTVGAVSQEAVVATDLGVYFFSWPNGVFLYDGSKPKWMFERIHPAVLDGRLNAYRQREVQLGWGNRRLWVSVAWEGAETRSHVFVMDPTLGKGGAWVFYDLGVGPFLEWHPPGDDSVLVAADTTYNRVLKLDQDVPYDNYGDGPVPITTRLRTRWVDIGEIAVPKRWKRPEVVLRAGTSAEIFVRSYIDFDPSVVKRTFTLNSAEADPEVPEEGVNGWGDKWGEFTWSRSRAATASERRNEIHRGSPLGNARAVALEFYGPDTVETWGVGSVTFKYIPRKVR